jgi:hypothetical protein
VGGVRAALSSVQHLAQKVVVSADVAVEMMLLQRAESEAREKVDRVRRLVLYISFMSMALQYFSMV